MFVGAVHEAVPALTALLASGVTVPGVITFAAGPAARASGAVDLAPLAQRAGVPLLRVEDLNVPEEVARVRELEPDLIVVVGWTRLLGREILAIPRRGCVGFHASLLPRLRGRAPVNWAILRGESVTGNTFMYLSEAADRGDIIDQEAIPIDIDDTCATLYERVGAVGAQLLVRHLPALLAGTAPRRPQGEANESPLPKRTPEMGVVDWDQSPRQVHDWIRALTHPYPGAFARLRGRPIRLWGSRLAPEGAEGLPGTLLGGTGTALRVACRQSSLLITTVQEEGSAEEEGARWMARRQLQGSRFDAVDPAVARWAQGLGCRPESDRGADGEVA